MVKPCEAAVLSSSEYERIASALQVPSLSEPWLKPLQKQYRLSEDVLRCIYKQLVQERVKHGGDVKRKLRTITSSYCKGVDFLELCYKVEVPTCLLLRRLLEGLCEGASRKAVTAMLRHPERVPELAPALDPRLALRVIEDVAVARACDSICSPKADAARLAVGVKYESKLQASLAEAGLAFWSEEELRSQGFVKTPDARLQVPVLYQDQVVTWLDSKATFGSVQVHRELCQDQYQAYLNRYGPGLVIYWFGYVDELAAWHSDILLATSLPVQHLIQLPQVKRMAAA